MRRLEAVEREKVAVAGREVEIQRLLGEAGEVYERLRGEAEAGAGGGGGVHVDVDVDVGGAGVRSRGWEGLGYVGTATGVGGG